MIKAAIIVAAVAILIATYLTDARLAPPVGAVMLFVALMYGWLANRSAGRANWRKAEDAAHRQREERAQERR
jgi:hypothetical protein